MPTENRSSNTEMVSVPRGLIEKLEQFGEGSTPARTVRRDVLEQVYALLVQPAPQHRSEPMAWTVGNAIWWDKASAERDSAEVGLPVIALGPIADPGEVERLRSEVKKLTISHEGSNALAISLQQQNESLHAQLAERDALLRDLEGKTILSWPDKRRISAALSASAEPSAPVEPSADEVRQQHYDEFMQRRETRAALERKSQVKS